MNEKIRENIPVEIREMEKEEAMRSGAMALFGEKYGDKVRVVTIDPGYSIELCGGTHLDSTGRIGLFTIVSESAVAAGVRRIEALTGAKAIDFLEGKSLQLQQVNELLKTTDAARAVQKIQEEKSLLEKRVESLEARQLVGIRNELMTRDEIINNVSFIGDILEVPNADSLKKLAFDLKHHLHDHVAVLCANIGGKAHVCISVSDTVVAARGLDAGLMIKQLVSPLIKGGGGGQKNLATAGGQDVSKLNEVIGTIRSEVEKGA